VTWVDPAQDEIMATEHQPDPTGGEAGAGTSGYPLERLDWVLMLGLLALSLLVRLWGLEDRLGPPDVDEGINGNVMLDILEGRGPGAVMTEPVVGEEAATFYVQALAWRLLGPSLFAFRLPAALAGALTVPLAYAVTRPLGGSATAAAAGLMLCFDPVHLLFSSTGNSIVWASLAQMLVLVLLGRALVRPGPGRFVALGAAVGGGLHTYPVFRLVALVTLGLVAVLGLAGARERERPPGRWCGSLAGALTLLLFLLPLLSTRKAFEGHLTRVLEVTLLGSDPASWVPTVFAHALELPGWLASPGSLPDGHSLAPRAVWLLAAAGFLGLLAPRAPRLAALRTALAVFALTALLPPLLITFEPWAARRFLLLAGPAAVLAALGLEALVSRLASRLGRAVQSAAVLGGACAVAAVSGLSAFPKVAPPPETIWRLSGFMAARDAAARATPPHTLLAQRSSFERPFLPGRQELAPNLVFLTRAFEVQTSPAPDAHPTEACQGDLAWLLDGAGWLPGLSRLHPAGRVEFLGDPDPSAGPPLHVYRVPAAQVRSRQGLTLQWGPPENSRDRSNVEGVALSSRAVEAGARTRAWSGAVFFPRTTRWSLQVRGPGRCRLRLDAAQVVDGSAAWLAEGWHEFGLEQQVADRAEPPPRLERASDDGQPSRPIPEEHYVRELPSFPGFAARPFAAPALSLELADLRLWPAAWHSRRLLDVLVRPTGTTALACGEDSFVRLTTDGAVETSLPGTGPQPFLLRLGPATDAFSGALAEGPDGSTLIADGPGRKLRLLSSTGHPVRSLEAPAFGPLGPALRATRCGGGSWPRASSPTGSPSSDSMAPSRRDGPGPESARWLRTRPGEPSTPSSSHAAGWPGCPRTA
jgi:hypothetical protein